MKLSETLDVGTKPIDKVHSEMPAPNTIDNVQMKSVASVKPLDATLDVKAKPLDIRIKPPKTVDKELAALLTKWDLDDAAKALAKHGWTTVSLLRQFNPDKHMDELGLSSGKVCGLIALLQSIPITVSVLYGRLKVRWEFEVLPSDSVGDLKRKVMAKRPGCCQNTALFLSNRSSWTLALSLALIFSRIQPFR